MMQDDDPAFFGQVALLTEAGRLDPAFAARVGEASTDEQIDTLVAEAKRRVEEASREA